VKVQTCKEIESARERLELEIEKLNSFREHCTHKCNSKCINVMENELLKLLK